VRPPGCYMPARVRLRPLAGCPSLHLSSR
jgi:hypothetical protein